MHTKALLAVLAVLANTATAFYPYIPAEHPTQGAQKGRMSTQIMKGFTYAGKQVPVKSDTGSAKAKLFRRARPAGTLKKRANDFQVQTGNPPTAPNSAAIDQDGTDFAYFAQMTFGADPGENLYIMLDTGSSAFWVMGSDCTDTACQSHTTFGPANSKTLQQPNSDSFTVGYSSGNVEGYIATDTVSFAGLSFENVAFGLANTTSSQFDSYPMDGILGLARSAAGTGFDQPTYLEILAQNKALKANLFGVHLNRGSDNEPNGEISFGAPDSSKYTGDINYIATNSNQNYWQIPADDIEVNGKSLNLGSRQAVIDTGTTYMMVPPADADAIFAQVPGSSPAGENYHLPCDTTTTISLVFNNVAYDISPKDYVGPNVGGSTCYTHIMGVDAVGDNSTWLLGDTFLKNVYSVFDVDSSSVGFADLASGSSSSSHPPASTGLASSGPSTGSTSSSTPVALGDEAASSTGTPRPTLTPVPMNGGSSRESVRVVSVIVACAIAAVALLL